MIDLVQVVSQIKDTVNMEHLRDKDVASNGWHLYELSNCKPIKVWINEEGEIKFKGSLPYFWQGHNFFYSLEDCKNTLEYISNTIQVDVFSGECALLEYGHVIPIKYPVMELLKHHIKIPRFKPQLYDYGKFFNGRNRKVKCYDAAKRLKQMTSVAIRDSLVAKGLFDPSQFYLKFENHYKNPHHHLNDGRLLTMEIVVSDPFQTILKNDLYNTYDMIRKTGRIEMPKTKKDLSSSEVVLIAFNELCEEANIDPIQYLKLKINAFGSILSIHDKKSRKRQICKLQKKLVPSENSIYDISKDLAKILEIDSSFIA